MLFLYVMLLLKGLNIINNAWVSSTILFSMQECQIERVLLLLLNTICIFSLHAKTSLLRQGLFYLWKSLTPEHGSESQI